MAAVTFQVRIEGRDTPVTVRIEVSALGEEAGKRVAVEQMQRYGVWTSRDVCIPWHRIERLDLYGFEH